MMTAANKVILGCRQFAGEGARATLDASSRRQCCRTRSRAAEDKTSGPAVQKVTKRSASALCRCGRRRRYRYLVSDEALPDIVCVVGRAPAPANCLQHNQMNSL